MNDSVTLRLSRDEALVLFEFFARFDQDDEFRLRSNAEFVAFMKVAGQLEKALPQPFQSNYQQLLADASGRLSAGYEGLAPGVAPMAKG